jgi:hypothetical protein
MYVKRTIFRAGKKRKAIILYPKGCDNSYWIGDKIYSKTKSQIKLAETCNEIYSMLEFAGMCFTNPSFLTLVISICWVSYV